MRRSTDRTYRLSLSGYSESPPVKEEKAGDTQDFRYQENYAYAIGDSDISMSRAFIFDSRGNSFGSFRCAELND